MPILIGSFYFAYFSIVAVYVIFMPKVFSMVGYSPSEIGIIFASAPLVRFIIPFLFLKGLKLNSTTFNLALLFIFIAALSFYKSIESFWPLLLSNVAMGIGMSLILPYIEVIALSLIGKESYGKVRLFGSIGFILVALVLVRYLDAPLMALHFLMAIVSATIIIAYITSYLDTKHTQVSSETHTTISLLKHWPIWLGMMLMQVSFGPFYNFFTIYETNLGISLETTIYLWSAGVVAEIILFYFQGPLLKRNLLLVMQVAIFITTFRWLLTYLFAQELPIIFFAQSLHAFSFALFHTAAISYLYEIYSKSKLVQQFFSGISYGLGAFIGAVSSGYIYEWWPNQLFLYAALIAALSLLTIRLGSKLPTN